MSVRVLTKNKTNTAQINHLLTDPINIQIIEALGKEELSFQELCEMFHRTDEKMSHDLNELVGAGVIARHFHHHHVTYSLVQPQLQQAIHILYELWADTVRSPRQQKAIHF